MRNALSVKVNMELLKYLPRPVGGLQGNQRCYSGKLADTQTHLELIMACACTLQRAHVSAHQHVSRHKRERHRLYAHT